MKGTRSLRGTEVRSIRDIRRRAAPRGCSFPFLVRFVSGAPEDNEHNYGEVFVLEITQ